jgi:replication-associated recombination protein RarA
MKKETGLDEERIEALAETLLMAIQENFRRGPVGRDRVYESLNALAFATAVVVRGSDKDKALEWFSQALNISLKE